MAALALSGDWAAEFLSGPDSASAPGLTSLGDAADADWTKEFIAEAAGSFSLRLSFFVHLLWNTPNFVPTFFKNSSLDPGRWAEEYLEQSEEKLWLGDLGDKESDW